MLKEITRTVLALPQTTYSTANGDGSVYDSGSVDVGDCRELAFNIVFDASGGTAAISAVDANGLKYSLDTNYPGHGPLSVGAGFGDDSASFSEQVRSNTAFGDTIRIEIFPASGNTSATCSISVKGK